MTTQIDKSILDKLVFVCIFGIAIIIGTLGGILLLYISNK